MKLNEFDRAVEKMQKFQTYLDDNKMLYTYIAPKEREKFFSFLAAIYHSSATHSLYLRLSNPEVVKKILCDLKFPEDTELEIYVASNDNLSTQWYNKTLNEFIEEKGINYQY
ncbi:MAG: hypothetical protein R6U04_00510 [Bacteroidales bacterium]